MSARHTAFALIGCGPRGMTVLERFVAHANRDPLRRPIVLHVIDPASTGAGIHGPQPDHLLLNTIAAQLTAFVDEAMIDGGGVRGPSLYEWAVRRGVTVTSSTGEVAPVRPADHLPRRLLGEYLGWAHGRLLRAAPPWLEVRLHRSTAVDVERSADGRDVVGLDDGTALAVDGVVLCVGHTGTPTPRFAGPGHPAGAWIGTPYPLPAALADVRAGDTVGLLGAGLTAMDVIAELTVGRGGSYTTVGGGLRYVASGAEPAVVLVTRTGLPARSRPRPSRYGRPEPRHLTLPALAQVRQRTTDGRLDLRRDVLPLVDAEVRHRITAMEADPVAAARIAGEVTGIWSAAVPPSALSSVAAYHAWFVDRVEQDLAEARLGLDASPLKAGLEVLRDLREVLRTAVDGAGMDEESLGQFFGPFSGEVNRNVLGPQLERNEELVALVRAGVVDPGLGPGCTLTWSDGRWLLSSGALGERCAVELDRVVCSYVPASSVTGSTNPVVRRLHASGRLTPVVAGRTELGARVDGDGAAIDAHGDPQPTLLVLGPLAEGSSYYNHYVTSPDARSRATVDADRAVRSLLSAGVGASRASDVLDRRSSVG